MQEIKVGLEWFLNPDHLPFIVGIEHGLFREAGLNVHLIEPEDHYDGLKAVAKGEIDFACNEPLHMVDEKRPGLRALGCFFETRGGVMLTSAGQKALRAGEAITLAAPVAGEVTDQLAYKIIEQWCQHQQIEFDPAHVSIQAVGFEHVKHMQQGYHGAWLCFANFEGVEARICELDAEFISSTDAGLPNFSALELFTGEALLSERAKCVSQFTRIVSDSAAWCRDNPADAARIWYRFNDETPSALMDAIIKDTCQRFIAPLKRDEHKWQAMWQTFAQMGLSRVSAREYQDLYC